MNEITVFVDARCLQDPGFQSRGVGSHVVSLVRSARTMRSRLRLVAMVDPALPNVPDSIRGCFDAVVQHANPVIPPLGAIFVAGSPMTHGPSRFMRLIGHRNVLSAAVIYDFIPYDLPGYLDQTPAARQYAACVEWLKLYDLFFPISTFSASRLWHYTGASPACTHVTGCAIRDGLARRPRPPDFQFCAAEPKATRYFVVAAGDDPRKNPEVVFKALALLRERNRADVRLKVVGSYSDGATKRLFSAISAHLHGAIEFLGPISDGELAAVYNGAVATIVPSRMEGFSLPVVESVACGAPVVASSCEAHRELMPSEIPLFDPHDPAGLAARMEVALDVAGWRTRTLDLQRELAEEAAPERVGRRFWEPLLNEFENRCRARRSASVSCRRPRIALVTPFPPDESGVARYSRDTVDALAGQCDVSVFSDAPKNNAARALERPVAGLIDVLPLLHPSFDAVVLVSGNSLFHNSILDLCERYGGPIIQHDTRLTNIYAFRWGQEAFRRRAEAIVGRRPSDEQVAQWLRDGDSPSLFLEPIINMADPLIVHSEAFRTLLKDRYGVDAALAPFAIARQFSVSDLGPAGKSAARARLGVAPEKLLVSTFGFAAAQKGSVDCVAALDLLREWGVPAELHFVGSNQDLREDLVKVVRELGLSDAVRMYPQFIGDDLYTDYLVASDIGIQVRTHGVGQLSAALTECIAAGMACVASVDLAEACEAPAFVRRVPNKASPFLIAEAVKALYESGEAHVRMRAERDEYVERHSFSNYARRLLEILGLGSDATSRD